MTKIRWQEKEKRHPAKSSGVPFYTL